MIDVAVSNPEDVVVQFTVRDLFIDIKNDLAGLRTELSRKADKSDVDDIKTQVDAINQWKSRMIGIALGVGLASGGVAGVISQAVGH